MTSGSAIPATRWPRSAGGGADPVASLRLFDKGGDAKLMIGVGACYGWWLGLEASVYAILLMGPVALAYMIFKGKIGSLWHHIRYLTIDQVKDKVTDVWQTRNQPYQLPTQ